MGNWGNIFGIPGQADDKRTAFPKKDLLRLQCLQNKAIRLIYMRDRSTPTSQLLKEANQMSVNQLIAYHMVLQTYKINASHQPEYHYDRLFEKKTKAYDTRSSNLKRVEFRLNIGQGLFSYQASRLLLSLSREMIDNTLKERFKTQAKTWIKDNIPIKP